MNSRKKLIGLTLVGALTLTGVSVYGSSIQDIKIAQAASSSVTVEEYIDLITRSLKSNYLGIKNIAQWKEYLREARHLNDQVSDSYRKSRNTEILNKAEALMNAADRVNQVEKSMEVNSHVMKNTQQWEYYITTAKEDLKKVDLYEFKYQHSQLVTRAEEAEKEIENIKNKYYKVFDKVEEMYYEAADLEEKNSTEAFKQAKYVKSLAENLESHNTKDFLIKRIDKLIKSIDDNDTNYTTQYIYNKDNISDLDSKKYSKVVIDTYDGYYNKRISKLRANVLEVRSGTKLILDNCEIGKLIVTDNKNKIEVVAQNNTIVERTILKSGAVISKEEDILEPLKKPIDANFLSIEVNTKSRVDIFAPATNLTLDARFAEVEVGAYIDFIKLRSDDQTLIVARNGTAENLTINTVVQRAVIEGSGKVIRLNDNSNGAVVILKNNPIEESTNASTKEEYNKALEKSAEEAVEKAKKSRNKEDKEVAQRAVSKLEKGTKKDLLQKELDTIYV